MVMRYQKKTSMENGYTLWHTQKYVGFQNKKSRNRAEGGGDPYSYCMINLEISNRMKENILMFLLPISRRDREYRNANHVSDMF